MRGPRKLFGRFFAFLLFAAVAAGVFPTFRYHPLIRRTIAPDGICGPFDEILAHGDWFRVTGDGASCFFGGKNGDDYYVVTMDELYGPFEGIVPLKAPAQSNSWGFAAQFGNRIVVVINSEIRFETYDRGRIYNPEYRSCYCHDIIMNNEKVTLSQDGSRWAFKVFRDDGEYVIVNGEEFGPYEKIYFARISPEGSNWGAVVAIEGYQYAIVNGEIYGPFGPASDLVSKYPHTHTEMGFSRKGTAWVVYGGRYTEKDWIIVNGESYGPYNTIDGFRWSDSGDSWCFTAIKEGQAYLLLNDLIWGPYEINREEGFFGGWPWGNISNDGSSWGSSFTLKEKEPVMINGKTYGPYDYASLPGFSDNNTTWGFAARKNGSEYVIIGGDEKGPYEMAFPPFLEGMSYAYWMKTNGSWYVVVNGAEWGPYSTGLLPEGKESYIKLSGPNWAFCDETEEGDYVVINGEAFGPYKLAFWYDNLKCNDDGSAWVYRVGKGDGGSYAVLNGVEYGPFGPGLFMDCAVKVFNAGDTVGFWAIEELPNKMYRLVKKTATGEGIVDEE